METRDSVLFEEEVDCGQIRPSVPDNWSAECKQSHSTDAIPVTDCEVI